MRQNLTIGIAGKFMAFFYQTGADWPIIFNNAIMDNRHPIRCDMRMRVHLGHTAMRCPARMANTHSSG